jgi:hypothetical protein
MIRYIIPWTSDKNLSGFYNREICNLENDDDWACFVDRDTYFPHPNYGNHIEAIINKHGVTYKLLTCMTNRVGTTYQCVKNMWTVEKGAAHEDRAKSLWYAKGVEVEDITNSTPISGMLILVQKKFITENRLLKDGLLLGADNDFHYIAKESGEKVGLMRGVYVYHYYRNGVPTNKQHLI